MTASPAPVLDFTPEPRVAAGVRVSGTGTPEIAQLLEAAATYAHAGGEREIDRAGHALIVLAEELGLHKKSGSFVTDMRLDGPGAPAVAQLTAAIHAYARATEDDYLEAGAHLCAAVEALEDLKKSQAVVTATLPGGYRRRPEALETPAGEEEPVEPTRAGKPGIIEKAKFAGPKGEQLWIRLKRIKDAVGAEPFRVLWQQLFPDGSSASGVHSTALELARAKDSFTEALGAAAKQQWKRVPILGRGLSTSPIPAPGAGTARSKKR